MESIDTTDMGLGKAALVFVLFGFIAIVVGAIVALFIWPIGLLFIGVGLLSIVGGPAVALLGWLRRRPGS